MKLKKKHFKRLKQISKDANEVGCFGLIGIQLDKLIAEIESVQKVKTVQERPISTTGFIGSVEYSGNFFDQHRKDVEANILKESESMVAASTDEGTEFKGGFRDLVGVESGPKIGDIGYFWTTGNDIHYGKLKEIISLEFKGKSYKVYRISNSDGCEFYTNFSKTPPELK